MAPPSEAARRLPAAGDTQTLYLVDISSYIFRAFHAIPPLSSPSGEPTNAVYGVTSMLQKLVQEQQPGMLAVALDAKGPSFRHELYDGYKANRPEAPPELRPQLQRVREVIEAYGIPMFEQAGMEADDLIASAVRKANERGMRVVVVSADKDLLQLVDETVVMYDTMREKVYGGAEAKAKLGVEPSQIRDYLALVGDASDNIPGVPSVGPKTAVKLLAEHRTLEGIYEHLDAISRKALRAKLEAHRDSAFLSQRLVTLREDLEVDLDPERLRYGGADTKRLAALFTELGFTRLLEKLEPVAAEPVAASETQAEPEHIEQPQACRDLVELLRGEGRFAWHLVTSGARAVHAEVVGIAFALADGRRFYVPASVEGLAVLAPLVADEGVAKRTADSKSDRLALAAHGIELAGVEMDVMLASYLLDADRPGHTLRDVAQGVLGLEVPETVRPPDTLSFEGEDAQLAGQAARLAHVTWLLSEKLATELERAGCDALLRDMEIPLARVLADMERTGVRVDMAQLRALSQAAETELRRLEQRCVELAGHQFNVASPRQLESILFDELGLPVIKRTKTARSTDQSVLEELAPLHDLPSSILEHRALAKLKSTYLDALPREVYGRTGRIHTEFRQAVAATGRLSSSEPNLQNIPIRTELGRRVRDAFVAREGWWILAADYSQIELRVLAHLSQDAELLEAFSTHEDVHLRTARAIFGVSDEQVTREMRAQAKTVNFAVIYGQTQFALARNLRIDRHTAGRYIHAFFERYAGVKQYMDRVIEDARETGYVYTFEGRRRRVPELRSSNRQRREAAERIARNTPIQGTAADIIKHAMIAVHDAIETRALQSKMVLSVHDELVFEVPPEEEQPMRELVRERMEGALKLDVPLEVDLGWGECWGAAH